MSSETTLPSDTEYGRGHHTGQQAKDFLFAPLRFLLSDSPLVHRLGLTPLGEERADFVARFCKGLILDMTCGANPLKERMGSNVVGMDILAKQTIDFKGDAHAVPIAAETFDTVVLVASLNYMADPLQVLTEAYRVLRSPGRLAVTMISPALGRLRITLQDPFLHTNRSWRGSDRRPGMRLSSVSSLVWEAGFRQVEHFRFMYGMNNLLVGHKPK